MASLLVDIEGVVVWLIKSCVGPVFRSKVRSKKSITFRLPEVVIPIPVDFRMLANSLVLISACLGKALMAMALLSLAVLEVDEEGEM